MNMMRNMMKKRVKMVETSKLKLLKKLKMLLLIEVSINQEIKHKFQKMEMEIMENALQKWKEVKEDNEW